MLFVENNYFASTVANELARNFNSHGGREALIIYLVMHAFDDYYRYLYYERFYVKYEEAIRCAEIKLNQYVENIYRLKSIMGSNEIDRLYDESSTIINRLGADYRLYFHIYYDPSRINAQEGVKEERIKLSPETKQKIGEMLTSSLQEKLK
jgi:hypothetical protein